MGRRSTATVLAAVLVLASLPAPAQHGHPLVGTWSGDWGPSPEQRNRVLLLLEYDGEAVTGVINPGPDPVPLTSASLDPTTWTVVRRGVRPNPEGNVIEYVIEGQIENVTSPTQRTITGIWTQGGTQGDFRVTLN